MCESCVVQKSLSTQVIDLYVPALMDKGLRSRPSSGSQRIGLIEDVVSGIIGDEVSVTSKLADDIEDDVSVIPELLGQDGDDISIILELRTSVLDDVTTALVVSSDFMFCSEDSAVVHDRNDHG